MIPSPVWKTEQNLITYKGHTTSNKHLHTTLKQATRVRTGSLQYHEMFCYTQSTYFCKRI